MKIITSPKHSTSIQQRTNPRSNPDYTSNSKASRYQEGWKSSRPNTQPRFDKEPTPILTFIDHIPNLHRITKRVELLKELFTKLDDTRSTRTIFRIDVMIRVSYRRIIIEVDIERHVRIPATLQRGGNRRKMDGWRGWMKGMDEKRRLTRRYAHRLIEERGRSFIWVATSGVGTSDVVKGGGRLERVYSSAVHSKRCTG